jgi:hypothetical protein
MATKTKDLFKVSPFEAKTLSWWKARRSKIDMAPPYQRRGRLWSATDKAYLIDSILNGFDVPKLYMADFSWGDSTLNKKRLPYAIIDGKQRLEALFDFYDGTITLNDDFVYRAEPSLKLAGLGYKDLVENYGEVAEIFDTYNLSVMSVVATSEDPINELFVRLNRNKPLTGAEIRNAMGGPAPEVFRKIAAHEFFKDYVPFAVSRGQDLNTAAKLVMFEFLNGVTSTKKINMDQFVKTAAKDRAKLELSARRVMDTLESMTEIFLPRDRLLASAGTVPVYYWFVRSLPARQHSRMRPFLNWFEEVRRTNRQTAARRGSGVNVDADMTAYDNFNRSTNDESSHTGRFDILTRQFAAFRT